LNETLKITLSTATCRETPVVKVEFVYNREQRIDLRLFRKFLGHKSFKTSEIYTHVSQKDLQKFKNPFDDAISMTVN
jgi:integrase